MSQSKNSLIIPVSIIFAGILIAGAVIFTGEPRQTPDQAPGEFTRIDVSIDDDVVLGDKDAPITIIGFGDYQCPFCKTLYDDAETQIREKYVDTGKAKLIFRDYPLDGSHPYARDAALAAQCAGDQDAYWQYHDALFERQNQIPSLDFTQLASELGLNSTQFQTCFDSEKYKEEIEADRQDGIRARVQGTPTTFVNGILIGGAQPFEVFETIIESELNNLSI